MFGLFSRNKIIKALRNDAVIIDVRTVHEYDQGRIPGSVHIPLERMPVSIQRIKGMEKPVIFVADGDSRSGKAMNILKQNGLKEVYNGGNWEKVFDQMRSL